MKNNILPIGPKNGGNTIWQFFRDRSFSKYAKLAFLTPDTYTYVCISGGKKCNFAHLLNDWFPALICRTTTSQLSANPEAGGALFIMHSDLAKLQARLLTCIFTEKFLLKAYNFRSTWKSLFWESHKKYLGNEVIAKAYSRRCSQENCSKIYRKFPGKHRS